ncbi:MAG: LysR family transcriptional regulator [Clostridia bacterium]|nr:LysR family transcriptional regulator [Clostridia bacterium]
MNTLDLEQLVSFDQSGNLSMVAQEFSISQPSVTRTMQRIEQELGVSLFSRTKNKIELNEIGKAAAEEAKLVLAQFENMKTNLLSLERQKKTICIASCEVHCIAQIVSLLRSEFPLMTISSEIKTTKPLLEGLENGLYDLVILPFEPKQNGIVSKRIGEEHLMIVLPKTHRLAKKNSIELREMNGENMLLYSEIGFWKDIVDEKMPSSRFLIQTERFSMEELMLNSTLPYFVTEKTQENPSVTENRVTLKIKDEDANPTFYLVTKANNSRRFAEIFKKEAINNV